MMTIDIERFDADRIREALGYIHYWESSERGDLRVSRKEAYDHAIKNLSPKEIDVLEQVIFG